MLDLIENLINEHGSSVILKERLEALKEQYEALQASREELSNENARLKNDLAEANARVAKLGSQLQELKTGDFGTYVCDHCGSPDLTRTGSREDPTFGVLGIKQKVFSCNICGKESAFTPEGT